MFDQEAARTLATIVECGSFSRASQELFIAKSSLKKRVDDLEAEVGAKLLDRTSHGVVPTAAGECFLKNVEPIIVSWDKLCLECARLAGASAGRALKIAVYTDFIFPLNRLAIDNYKQNHSSDSVSVVATRFSSVYEGLRRGDCDVAFCPRPKASASGGLASVPLFRTRLYGMTSRGAFGQKRTISRADLAARRVGIHRLWYEQEGIAGWSSSGELAFEVEPLDEGEIDMQILCNEGGVYLLPKSEAGQYPYEALPLEDVFFLTNSIVYAEPPSPAVVDFVHESIELLKPFVNSDTLELEVGLDVLERS